MALRTLARERGAQPIAVASASLAVGGSAAKRWCSVPALSVHPPPPRGGACSRAREHRRQPGPCLRRGLAASLASVVRDDDARTPRRTRDPLPLPAVAAGAS